MKYRKIREEFTLKGYSFKMVSREGDYAVYEQSKSEHINKTYEVVRIRRHDGYAIAGNNCPPSEMYPSSEKWGVDAFTANTKKAAFAKMDWMMNHQEELEEASKKRNPKLA